MLFLMETTMNKRDSLRILVQYTTLFSAEMKESILRQLDFMSDEDVESLGILLATEKKEAVEGFDKQLMHIDQVVQSLEAQYA
jgi:hypothetical protein